MQRYFFKEGNKMKKMNSIWFKICTQVTDDEASEQPFSINVLLHHGKTNYQGNLATEGGACANKPKMLTSIPPLHEGPPKEYEACLPES